MKTILIVLPNTSNGGAEHVTKTLVNYLSKLNFKIDILFMWSNTLNDSIWQEFEKFENIEFHFGRCNLLIGFFSAISHLLAQKTHFDYVFTTHVNCSFMVGLLRVLNLFSANKFIVRESTSIFSRFKGLKLMTYKLRYFVGYRNIDLLICQSDVMKKQLVQNTNLYKHAKHIVTIGNPVALEEIYLSAEQHIIFSNEVELKKKKVVVSAGRLINEKGFDVLINAFSAFSKERDDYELHIFGEGMEQRNLEELIGDLKLADKVFLRGYTEDIISYFKRADICVVSSRIEGFPNVLLQMIAVNNNVISTMCAGGIEDIPGITLIPTNDVRSLTCALTDNIKRKDNRKQLDDYLAGRSVDIYWNRISNFLEL